MNKQSDLRSAQQRVRRIERARAALNALLPGELKDVRHDVFVEAQRNLVIYAHHLGMCRSHGGHDCDCGKDDLVKAATTWM